MKISCPQCGQKYEVDSSYVGNNVECSECKYSFVVTAEPAIEPVILLQVPNLDQNIHWWTWIIDLLRIKSVRRELEKQKHLINEFGLLDAQQRMEKFIAIDKEIKARTVALNKEISERTTALDKEIRDRTAALDKEISERTAALDKVVGDRETALAKLENDIATEKNKLAELKEVLVETNEEVLIQSFGLYTPQYDFLTSDVYKDKLNIIRAKQKDMIKNGEAVTGNNNWTVNGSHSQGKKMVSDMQKLLLRAFNGECEEITDRVTYSNYEASKKRIVTSGEAISKLGKIMDVAITPHYFNLKQEELALAFEYRQKKQKEKEEQKAIREQMREEAKIQREIEESRRKIEKEQTHYHNALSSVMSQLENASGSDKDKLLAKKTELESELSDIEISLKDIDYREANQKAGYVYVISNIGAFGENIYKIGMTRRLDPTERIDELGDASVPFDFDIHAMIFSDNAPGLEAALHRAFEQKKLNWVNTRREFFNVTLDEIKEVVKINYDKTAEFIETAAAEQYRVSQKMKQGDDGTIQRLNEIIA